MISRLKPSPSMAVALLALFLALAAGAYAQANLPANSVGTGQIRNGAVTNAKLAHNSVWHAQIGTRSARNNNLAANSVWHAQIGTGSVQRNNVSAQLFSELQGAAAPASTILSVAQSQHLATSATQVASGAIATRAGQNHLALVGFVEFVNFSHSEEDVYCDLFVGTSIAGTASAVLPPASGTSLLNRAQVTLIAQSSRIGAGTQTIRVNCFTPGGAEVITNQGHILAIPTG